MGIGHEGNEFRKGTETGIRGTHRCPDNYTVEGIRG